MNATTSSSLRATCKEYLHVQAAFVLPATVKDSLTVRKAKIGRLVAWAVVKDYLTTRSVRKLGDKA